MADVTCTNCNCDVSTDELRRNNLCCPTCGFDLSEAEEVDDWDAEDEDEDDDELEDDEDEEEEEEKEDEKS